MTLTFRKLHPHFAAEVSPLDLRQAYDHETLSQIQEGMDEYAILIFRDQAFSDDEHLAFGQRLEPPSNPFDEPRLVAGPRFFAEHFAIPNPQFADGHPPQRGDLFPNVQGHLSLLVLGISETVNRCGH